MPARIFARRSSLIWRQSGWAYGMRPAKQPRRRAYKASPTYLYRLYRSASLPASNSGKGGRSMGRRWKWFLRPGSPAIDLTGQVVADGDVPGRNRRPAGEDVVLDVRMTSRCDRAVVYERPERRWAA